MKRLLPILALLLIALAAGARRQRTGPSQLRPESLPQEEAIVVDTIAVDSGAIRLSGYDKPNSAAYETFFITNLMPDSLAVGGIIVTLTYLDMSGRQLHERVATVMTDIPPGQTRAARIPTWDLNRAFHYFRSSPPQRRISTRYQVRARVTHILR